MTTSDSTQLGETWRSLEQRIEALEKGNSRTAAGAAVQRTRTALDRLAAKYRKFSILSLAMTFSCTALFMLSEIFTPQSRLWITVVSICYFALASTMDYWLSKRIGEIDVLTLPVSEVVQRALTCRRRHHQFMMILIPLCAVVLGLFIWGAGGNIYLIAGMGAGAVIGLAIGLRQYFDFMAQYRILSSAAIG